MIKFSSLLFVSFVILLALWERSGFPSSMKDGNFFPYIIDKPFTEDGFYMMTVAWNIADGKGITYNLERPTTGIQPLVTFLQAGIAKAVLIFGGNKTDFLRAMIIASSLILFIFSLTSGNITHILIPGFYSRAITVFLVLFSFDLFNYFHNGQETGFYLLMISVCILYSFHFIKKPDYKSAVIFGLLAGITALTRVDFIFPLFIYLLFLFIFQKIKVDKLILILIIGVALLIPWIGYVYSVTGSIYPTSASSQTSIITPSSLELRSYYFIESFLNHLTPFLATHNLYISLAVTIINGIILYFFIKRLRLLETFDRPAFRNLLGWGISFFFLGLSYLIYSSAPYFYLRYTTPFYLFIFLISVCFLCLFFRKVAVLYRKFFYAVVILCFFIQVYYYQFNGKIDNHLTIRIAYIKNHFDESERIGLFQSGVTGFFIKNALNLDGKVDHVVNQYGFNNRFGEFLDSMKINVIIEWRKDFNFKIDEKYFTQNWKIVEKDIGDGTTSCYIRRKQF